MIQDKYLIEPDFADAAKILRGYKNKYEGKRCFIIGNGPSLRAEDLDKIHENGDFSIASNRVYLIFNKTKWRPDIFTACDQNGIKGSIREMSDIDCLLKIFPCEASGKKCLPEGGLPILHDIDNLIWMFRRSLPKFSEDITDRVYAGKTITYVNIQIAAYLGFKEIILLGCDHSYKWVVNVPNVLEGMTDEQIKDYFSVSREITLRTEKREQDGYQDHFDEHYMDNLVSDGASGYHIDIAELAYKSAKQYAEAHGIKILNATRGGRLEVFERVDFDSLFNININQDEEQNMTEQKDNWIEPDYASAAEVLKKYKEANQERFKGKRCFIIGNGPSLKPEDLDKIKEQGDFSIASNRIYLIFDKTEWRPNIYTTIDEHGIDVSRDDISALQAELKIIPVIPPQKTPEIDGAVYLPQSTPQEDYNWILNDVPPPFAEDITSKIYNGKSITYINMQLAAYLGFKEIVLIGMDHCYPKMAFMPKIDPANYKIGDTVTLKPEIRTFEMENGGSKSGHFCDNYLEGLYGWKDGDDYPDSAYQIESVTLAYQAAKKYADAHGIKIFNATRGGKLEVFQRVNFDDVFKPKEPEFKMVTPNFMKSAKILRAYKDKFVGRRCFIIGNGPSLKAADLDKIHENGDFSIASNRIYLIFKETEWRPDIYTTKDITGIRASISEMSGDFAKLLKIIPMMPMDKAYPVEGAIPVRIGRTNNMYLMTRGLPEFSDDITKCVHTTVTITYTNIQIAIYMGFKEIYLLGVDHQYAIMWHFPADVMNYDLKKNKNNYQPGQILSFQPELQYVNGVKNHFCDNYMEGIKDENGIEIGDERGAFAIDEATLSYQAAKQYAQTHGIKIKNATRGGKLNVFQRVDFDSLFPKK